MTDRERDAATARWMAEAGVLLRHLETTCVRQGERIEQLLARVDALERRNAADDAKDEALRVRKTESRVLVFAVISALGTGAMILKNLLEWMSS